MVVMAAVAVMSALMGPWMRSWSSLQWTLLGFHLTTLLLTFGGMLLRRWRKRSAALLLAGDVHWVVPITPLAAIPAPHPFIFIAPNAYLATLVGVFELMAFAAIEFSAINVLAALWPCMAGIGIGLFAGGGAFDEPCPPARVWIADGGLFFGMMFVPHLSLEFSVSYEDPSRSITVYWDRFTARLELPPDIHKPVFDFLSAHMRRIDRIRLGRSVQPPEK